MKSRKQDPKSFEKYLDSNRLFSHIISHGKDLPLADAAIYLQEYSGDKVRIRTLYQLVCYSIGIIVVIHIRAGGL